MTISVDQRLTAVAGSGLVGTGVEERFDRITRIAAYLQDTAMATISVVDASHEHFKSSFGVHLTELELSQSLAALVITEADLMVVPDATRDVWLAEHPMVAGAPYVRFYAGFPIFSPSNLVIGVLSVLDHRPHRSIDKLRQGLGDLAAIVESEIYSSGENAAARARIAREISQLKERAFTDSLTRIWNRGAIMDFLARELARSRRRFSALAVVMIDLDHFKHVNDEFGHIAGDAVLRQAGQRLSRLVRSYDGLGRYGGEEFLAVLTECTLDVARMLGERICEQMASEPYRLDDGTLLTVTASLGIAVGTAGPGMEAETFVKLADQALYRAKYAGRNRVEMVALEPQVVLEVANAR